MSNDEFATMPEPAGRPEDEVEQLLRNAELRDELEPYLDESVAYLASTKMPTETENEFLASMLAWERAPALPIREWFTPPLELPAPDELGDARIHEQLWKVIEQLFEQRIVLEFTDHLSDRELYRLICRDILPSYEKKIANSGSYLHWDCSSEDPDVWLRYYATVEEREGWSEGSRQPLPPREQPPFPRKLPKQPL